MNPQELAGIIAKTFEENPHIHEQSSWSYTPAGESIVVSSDPNICNTTMCLAGSVQWLLNGKEGLRRISGEHGASASTNATKEAADALGLSPDESYVLFNETTNTEAIEAINKLAKSKADFDAYISDRL